MPQPNRDRQRAAPKPTRPPSRSTRSHSAPDALERLYVYWLVSAGLLILAVLVVAMMTRGALRRQASVTDELAERVTTLEQEVRGLEAALRPPRPVLVDPGPPPPTPTSAETSPEQPREVVGSSQDRVSPPVTPPTVTAPPEDAIRSQLDEVMSDDPTTPADVAAPEAAAELLETALKHIGRARWSAAVWSRLAILARLLGCDAAAQAFAKRADAGGDALISYAEVSARSLLARGRPREALPIVTQLVERSGGSPTAWVLLAAAFLGTGDPASADEVLATLPAPAVLETYDSLLLARVLLALERWRRLDAVLSTVREVPPELAAERSFLLAVSLARSDRTVEALAILDGLLAEADRGPGAITTTADASPARAWPTPEPDRYEIEVWRGVTLMHARQPETAREVLQQAAELDPGRADAHYYLGLVEARAGRPEIAMSHLKNALASSAHMAPAWEALALLEIDEGHVNRALQHLAKAVEINSRRASAYLLMAIAYAKISQRESAAEALRTAFHLDERYLVEAKQTDVLLRLFTPSEMDGLAAEPVLDGPAPQRPDRPTDNQ